MIALLYIGITLAMWAVVHLVRMGCRSIVQLSAELNRDQVVEYRHAVPPPAPVARRCPDWLLVANGKAAGRG